MDHRGFGAGKLVAQLADGLDERQALDIADRSADLAQHKIEIIGVGERELLDGVGHVRDHLHRRAQIVAAPLAGDDVAIDPPARDVIGLPRRDPGEALVMAEVEVRLGAVVGDVDLAVLVRAHRARIYVEIGIELANPHAVSARLQEGGEAGRHQTLAKR